MQNQSRSKNRKRGNLEKEEIAVQPLIYILKSLSIKRAIWVKLFTQCKICEIENSILGTCPMIPGVLAEILQLLKRATAKHLSQKQKQPVDCLLLVCNNRLRAVFLFTEPARRKNRIQPNTRSPITHAALVLPYKEANFIELFFKIKFHLIRTLTPLALNLASNRNYLLGLQVIHILHSSTMCCGPWEQSRHRWAPSLTWHLCRVTTRAHRAGWDHCGLLWWVHQRG